MQILLCKFTCYDQDYFFFVASYNVTNFSEETIASAFKDLEYTLFYPEDGVSK